MAVYEYKTKIRYNDINEENELSDKGLLNVLSEAAGVHSDEVGYSLNTMDKTNYVWMLLYWKIQVYERPRWNTNLIIKTWPRGFSKVSSWRDFEVYNEEGKKIAIASTEWVLVDAQKRNIARITDKMIEEYDIVSKKVFTEEITGKLKEPENMEKVYEYTSKRRDIDVNHHVNNVVYLELAYDALPKDINVDFNNLEIFYKKQVKLGEELGIFYGKDENAHYVSIKSPDGKVLHAVLKFF